MRVLVTGVAGFVGSHVAERLVNLGYDVVGVDKRDPEQDEEARRNLHGLWPEHGERRLSAYCTFDLDTAGPFGLITLLKDRTFDAVIHLAARPGVRASILKPEATYLTNVVSTERVLHWARYTGVRRVLFASSSSVYGNSGAEWAQRVIAGSPLSPYAASKRMAELALAAHHHLYGGAVTALRLFTVYGPRQRPDLAIRSFYSKLMAGEPLTVFGDGYTTRDYTYVTDVAAAFALMLNMPDGFKIYDVGRGEPILLSDMIRMLEAFAGQRANIQWQAENTADARRTCADPYAMKNLGWQPMVNFEDGLKQFVEWAKEEL